MRGERELQDQEANQANFLVYDEPGEFFFSFMLSALLKR